MRHTHHTTHFIEPINQHVRFGGTPRMEDAGIGPYEFWGAKGYDSRLYASCEYYGIDWNRKQYSAAHNALIEQYLYDNYQQIEHEIIQQAEAEAMSDSDY